MRSLTFSKTILISLLGHLTVFSIFAFSFGPRLPHTGYSRVVFWGQFLENSQVIRPLIFNTIKGKAQSFERKEIQALDKKIPDYGLAAGFYLKPPLAVAAQAEKVPFMEQSPPQPLFYARRESTVMFHPFLPYSFALYFRDRQVAHVELEFRALEQDQRNFITVKRKISSGNLEVDLLSIRYIERYLFMQQKNFASPDWHSVKIDLSAKND